MFWPRYTSDALSPIVSDPAGAIAQTQSSYDVLDRPLVVTSWDEQGVPRNTVHTWSGFTHTTENAKHYTMSETRDVWGKQASTVDANGKATGFLFDAFGNLARTTDAKGNLVTVSYNTWGRRTQLDDPDLGTITYGTDALGQVWFQASPNEARKKTLTTMKYDALGRLTQRAASDLTATWTYDVLAGQADCAAAHSCGKLVGSSTPGDSIAPDFRQQQTYDALGRPDTTTTWLDTSYTSKMGYDTWGRPAREEHQRAGSAVRAYDRKYDVWGQLARIERAGQAIWTATGQDAAQRITGALLGNGLKVERVFNGYTGRLSDGSVGGKIGEAYSYDVLGNVQQRTQSWPGVHFSEIFEYDGLNRLRQATITGATPQVFGYDDIGNMLRKTGVGTGDYVYGTAGGVRQPHAVGTIPGVGPFAYDDNGNLTSGAGRTVTWTSFDMPVKITGADGAASTFYYGPDHQRIKQLQAGMTTWYAGAMEVELRPSPALPVIKTYLPNGLGVEIDRGGAATELYYTHVDRLGSVMAITNASGDIAESLAYDSWGKRRALDSAATPNSLDGVVDNKGYTGHEMLDKLDLVHMNGRVYDPLVARFISADPYIQSPEHSQSYNRYTYVWNNPTNLTDPTGFVAEWTSSIELQACAQSVGCQVSGNSMTSFGFGSSGNWGPTRSVDGSGGQGRNTKPSETNSTNKTDKTYTETFEQDKVFPNTIRHTGREVKQTPNYADQVMGGFLTFDPTEGALRIAGLNQQNAMIGSMVLGVVNPRQWASKAVKKLTSKGLVDLTEHRAAHILNRHSAGAGISGKTEFPARWADDEVLHHVSDVATDPSAVTGLGKWNSPYAIGTRDGVTIRVDFYPNDHATYAGKISTAYPINVPPNP